MAGGVQNTSTSTSASGSSAISMPLSFVTSALDKLIESNYFAATVVGAGCLLGAAAFSCGLYYGQGSNPAKSKKSPRDRSDSLLTKANGVDNKYKMVLCVRMDLKMGKGKVAAQCCHATLGVFKKLWRKRDPVLRLWEDCGQPKVTLQCSDEEAMLELYQRAKEVGVPTYIVVDAGRTQVAPNSRTVMAVGPALEEHINQVTGGLKLL